MADRPRVNGISVDSRRLVASRKLSRNGLGGDQWRFPRSRLLAQNCNVFMPRILPHVEAKIRSTSYLLTPFFFEPLPLTWLLPEHSLRHGKATFC